MKRVKEAPINLILLIFVCLLCGCINKNTRLIKSGSYGSFMMDTTYSFDNKYYAIQSEYNKKIIITVYNSDTDEPEAEFSPARAVNFWGICWENDTYNIWVQSDNKGTFCYKHNGEEWVLDKKAKMPGYIVSDYGE